MSFEITTLVQSDKTTFRGTLDFGSPEELLALNLNFKMKISAKTLRHILTLPLSEIEKWFPILNEPPINFKHFWTFCQRFSSGKFEHGDNESYEKASFLLTELKKKKYKIDELPNLVYASYVKNKVLLIQQAFLDLDAPIHQIPALEPNRHRPKEITSLWNEWLDARRNPKNVSLAWGDLVEVDEESEEAEPSPKKDSKKKKITRKR
jgi:hypothetical protein